MNKKKLLPGILKTFGPGILFACVTIGGANFVQATHAGADYGLKLIPLILLIYLLKYPFFEFAERYSATKKETLLEGYLKIGRPALLLYIILVACTAFPTLAALSLIDANITAYFLNTTISPLVLSIGLLGFCALILLLGEYPVLERLIKLIIAVLIICSVTTFFIALPEGMKELKIGPPYKIDYFTEFTFLVALMGWMPAPIDVSVWTTLWTKAKSHRTKQFPSLRASLFDFNTGYIISGVLIIIFVSLSAFVMFTANQSFSTSGIILIEQLITLFTTHIGRWGEPFIAIIIFSALLSATLTCLDGYPRALSTALTLYIPKLKNFTVVIYWLGIIFLYLTSVILSGYFLKSLKQLVDIATILAFLTAPIFGYLNYRVVTTPGMIDKDAAPSKSLLLLSRIGLIFLITVSVLFIVLFIWSL